MLQICNKKFSLSMLKFCSSPNGHLKNCFLSSGLAKCVHVCNFSFDKGHRNKGLQAKRKLGDKE